MRFDDSLCLDDSKDAIKPRAESISDLSGPRDGDFHKTSRGHELFQRDNKYFMRSTCLNTAGEEVRSEICLDDFLENDRGHLKFVEPNGPKHGLFSHSAQNIRLTFDTGVESDAPVLEADLHNGTDGFDHSRFELSIPIENIDGSLKVAP